MTEPKKKLISPFVKQCYVCATVCINVLSNGCAYGFPAILLPQLKLPDSPIPLTNVQESWIAAVVTIAMVVGNFSVPAVMDRLGRKKAHFLVMIPTAIGWLLIIFATNVQNLLIARMMHGLSLGQVALVRAVIIGEYTSPKNRGAFLTLISVAQSSGVFIVHLLGSLLKWQTTGSICILFTMLSFIMTFMLPESPSWLADSGKYTECRRHFVWLRGDGEDQELDELIRARIKHNTSNIDRWRTIQNPEFYRPIIISLHVSLVTYFSGTMTIAVYGTEIVSQVMGSNVDAHFWLVCLDTTRIVTSFLAVYLVGTFKRRTVMLYSVALCLLTHIMVVAHVCTIRYNLLTNRSWIPAVLLVMQCFTMSAGILPMNSIIVGEIFPLAHRTLGISVTTAIATGFHFSVLKTFPDLLSAVGIEGVYGTYAAVIFYASSVIWCLMPETKGRTLQQIEDSFKNIDTRLTEMECLNGQKY